MVLLRLLFPSWAFFDRVVSVPILELRTFDAAGGATPWRSALRVPARGVGALVYHPDGTGHLAHQGLVDRFVAEQDLQESDPTTAALVAALAAWALGDTTCARWQWRIVESAPSGEWPTRIRYCSAELPRPLASADA